MSQKAPLFFAVGLIIGAIFVFGKPFLWVDAETSAVRRAAAALSQDDWPAAEEFAKQALAVNHGHAEALVIAGIAVARQHRTDESLRLLLRVTDRETPTGIAGLCEQGRRYMNLGQIAEAETCFAQVLAVAPEDLIAPGNWRNCWRSRAVAPKPRRI